MEKKLIIPFGEYEIVAETYGCDDPKLTPELFVYIRDKDNAIIQGICLVRPHYDYKNENNDLVDCLVWSDSNCEDYTKKYVIDVYKEEERDD